jgi:serine O-acetyltransferase
MEERKEDGIYCEPCREELARVETYKAALPEVVERVISSSRQSGRFTHLGAQAIPATEVIVDLTDRAIRILFPGYFLRNPLEESNFRYVYGQEMVQFFELLSRQVTSAIRHDCLRFSRQCVRCEERGQEAALEFLEAVPRLQEMLAKDVQAAFEGDPAARHFDEIIFSYPGLYAIAVFRVAHQLHEQGVPLIPRIMTECAHSRTGIDIHPGVRIGESFFIDHGTGVVVGETTTIGNRVRLYQGVTLGALSLSKEECESLRTKKRHPTIEDDVIIYANATILGGDTVIGARSVIGGNVWLTASVPVDTIVFLKKPDLVFLDRREKDVRSPYV